MKKNIGRALLCLIITTSFAIWANASERKSIGYFSPGGVRDAFASDVDMATISAIGKEAVVESLQLATERGLLINLDLGDAISQPRAVDKLNTEYQATSGQGLRKYFLPNPNNKLRDFLPDAEIKKIVSEYALAIIPYRRALYSVFVIDEPYLNGVSNSELERVGSIVRGVFSDHGFDGLKIGVLFAGAFFNAEFAERTQAAAFGYVERIDQYRISEERRIATLTGASQSNAKLAHAEWIEAITQHRLTTYDSAGNMYIGGGIPNGYDIVAFDFYLSTFLFDALYEDALIWLSSYTQIPDCREFRQAKASAIRSELSFFQDGPPAAADHIRGGDEQRLDSLYNCRIGAVLQLLNQQLAEQQADNVEVMVVTESSTNGMMEFDSSTLIEEDQPEALIRRRVTDEVKRALKFLQNRNDVDHILFFTFEDAHDYSINLNIGGVASIPEAVSIITAAAKRNGD